MILEVKGKDGTYLVKDPSNIIQLSMNAKGENMSKSKIHIITDTIENMEDRQKVSAKILEYTIK